MYISAVGRFRSSDPEPIRARAETFLEPGTHPEPPLHRCNVLKLLRGFHFFHLKSRHPKDGAPSAAAPWSLWAPASAHFQSPGGLARPALFTGLTENQEVRKRWTPEFLRQGRHGREPVNVQQRFVLAQTGGNTKLGADLPYTLGRFLETKRYSGLRRRLQPTLRLRPAVVLQIRGWGRAAPILPSLPRPRL